MMIEDELIEIHFIPGFIANHATIVCSFWFYSQINIIAFRDLNQCIACHFEHFGFAKKWSSQTKSKSCQG